MTVPERAAVAGQSRIPEVPHGARAAEVPGNVVSSWSDMRRASASRSPSVRPRGGLDKTQRHGRRDGGFRHIRLLVADLDLSIRFYGDAFGMKEKFRDGDDLVFLNTLGTHDSLALHLVHGDERVGESGGYEHFGITVKDRESLDDAIATIEAAGGTLIAKGEHTPGVQYAYVRDPDGYVIEI